MQFENIRWLGFLEARYPLQVSLKGNQKDYRSPVSKSLFGRYPQLPEDRKTPQPVLLKRKARGVIENYHPNHVERNLPFRPSVEPTLPFALAPWKKNNISSSDRFPTKEKRRRNKYKQMEVPNKRGFQERNPLSRVGHMLHMPGVALLSRALVSWSCVDPLLKVAVNICDDSPVNV